MAEEIVSDKQPSMIARQLKLVVQWGRRVPRDSEFLQLFVRLLADSKAYADNVSNLTVKVELLR